MTPLLAININNQVAWPNGHGVSLTIRSEKVPGSIPGATMFLLVLSSMLGRACIAIVREETRENVFTQAMSASKR
ncbi:hypothetical protein N7453_004540 [Penicillium expansum]|nr:hypothetical protein N7453_004540 [Penicillium expansum]